jgi:hypothetical protein
VTHNQEKPHTTPPSIYLQIIDISSFAMVQKV